MRSFICCLCCLCIFLQSHKFWLCKSYQISSFMKVNITGVTPLTLLHTASHHCEAVWVRSVGTERDRFCSQHWTREDPATQNYESVSSVISSCWRHFSSEIRDWSLKPVDQWYLIIRVILKIILMSKWRRRYILRGEVTQWEIMISYFFKAWITYFKKLKIH